MSETRQCGECVACCVYHEVHEGWLDKPANTPCPKLQPLGATTPFTRTGFTANCTAHAIRPRCCAVYRCAWLDGAGADDERPDMSGILVDAINQVGAVHNAVVAKQLWDGAAQTKLGRSAINNVSRWLDVPVLVLSVDCSRLMRVAGRAVE